MSTAPPDVAPESAADEGNALVRRATDLPEVRDLLQKMCRPECAKEGECELKDYRGVNLPAAAASWDPMAAALYVLTDGVFDPRHQQRSGEVPEALHCSGETTAQQPLVSVISPTMGSRSAFHQLLYKSFCTQTYEPKELIVIDSGPQPSRFMLEKAMEDPCVTYRWLHGIEENLKWWKTERITSKGGRSIQITVGTKRNIACQLARGDIIAHFDDDDMYAKNYLEAMTKDLMEGIGGLELETSTGPEQKSQALRRGGHLKPFIVKLLQWHTFDIDRRRYRWLDLKQPGSAAAGQDQDWKEGWGFSYVFSRTAWQNNPYPDVTWPEDRLFFEQATKQGITVRYLPIHPKRLEKEKERGLVAHCSHVNSCTGGERLNNNQPAGQLMTKPPDSYSHLEKLAKAGVEKSSPVNLTGEDLLALVAMPGVDEAQLSSTKDALEHMGLSTFSSWQRALEELPGGELAKMIHQQILCPEKLEILSRCMNTPRAASEEGWVLLGESSAGGGPGRCLPQSSVEAHPWCWLQEEPHAEAEGAAAVADELAAGGVGSSPRDTRSGGCGAATSEQSTPATPCTPEVTPSGAQHGRKQGPNKSALRDPSPLPSKTRIPESGSAAAVPSVEKTVEMGAKDGLGSEILEMGAEALTVKALAVEPLKTQSKGPCVETEVETEAVAALCGDLVTSTTRPGMGAGTENLSKISDGASANHRGTAGGLFHSPAGGLLDGQKTPSDVPPHAPPGDGRQQAEAQAAAACDAPEPIHQQVAASDQTLSAGPAQSGPDLEGQGGEGHDDESERAQRSLDVEAAKGAEPSCGAPPRDSELSPLAEKRSDEPRVNEVEQSRGSPEAIAPPVEAPLLPKPIAPGLEVQSKTLVHIWGEEVRIAGGTPGGGYGVVLFRTPEEFELRVTLTEDAQNRDPWDHYAMIGLVPEHLSLAVLSGSFDQHHLCWLQNWEGIAWVACGARDQPLPLKCPRPLRARQEMRLKRSGSSVTFSAGASDHLAEVSVQPLLEKTRYRTSPQSYRACLILGWRTRVLVHGLRQA